MRARFAYVEAILTINTLQAVQQALAEFLDMMRLCRGDNMGLRDFVPALYLRLGQDQQCYDFVKWWAKTLHDDHYDSGDMNLGYLDLKDADAFEKPDHFCGKYGSINHQVSVTLIKIRLLRDLQALQQSTTAVGDKLPREVFDMIRGQMVSNTVAGRKDVMERADQSDVIYLLEKQIDKLYKAVQASNKHFWPVLLEPGDALTQRPEHYTMGSREDMMLTL